MQPRAARVIAAGETFMTTAVHVQSEALSIEEHHQMIAGYLWLRRAECHVFEEAFEFIHEHKTREFVLKMSNHDWGLAVRLAHSLNPLADPYKD